MICFFGSIDALTCYAYVASLRGPAVLPLDAPILVKCRLCPLMFRHSFVGFYLPKSFSCFSFRSRWGLAVKCWSFIASLSFTDREYPTK
jgi:hypothetical protein